MEKRSGQLFCDMGDDLLINADALSRLFEVREHYKLWILQPAYTPKGRISHEITLQNPKCFMRYTNFVEVTCPLFAREKLDQFMNIYDPILVGYGIDWWYLDFFGPDLKGKVAIADAIPCINPHEQHKGIPREISTLQADEIRIKHWKDIKQKWHLKSDELGATTYGYLPKQDTNKWLQWIHRQIQP